MRILFALALALSISPGMAAADPCCLLPDNGTGTSDLPPDCPPDGYLGSLALIDGLPAGGTMDMDAWLTNMVVSSQTPGGSLGGTIEVFTAQMLVEVAGAGTLAGFHRNLVVPVTGETHSAPRVPGNAVQSFNISVYKLQGILTADYDFNELWFEGGAYYGLPSPGHTTLTRQGGPGDDFAVESSFDYFYRIQFDGRQGSEWLEGYRGTTLDLHADYALCSQGTALGVPELPTTPALRMSANPFRASTDVMLGAWDHPLTLTVFDSRGRVVRRLLEAERVDSARSIPWDGRDDAGRPLPGGVYFLSLRAGDATASQRVVRMP